MAKKRMFNLGVLETDAFMDLPLSAQALYFHLNMRADDDGFIGNPKRVTQNIGASIDDLKLLVLKRFLLAFDDGVVVVKHWRMHNAIKRDRYTQTNYIEDLKLLDIKENGAYTLVDSNVLELPRSTDGAQTENEWSTDGAQMPQTCSPDIGLGLVEVSIEKEIPPKGGTKKEGAEVKPERHKYGEYGWVLLTDEQRDKLVSEWGQAEFDRCVRYVDENAQGNGNKNEWKDWNLVLRRCHREGWGKRGYGSNRPSREEPDPNTYDYTGIENEIWKDVLKGGSGT